MILKLLVSGLVLVGGFFAVNTPAPQDEKDMEKIMAMYEKAAMPGDIHKGLASLVGKWDTSCEFLMGPTPTKTTGTCEYRSVLGSRFVVAESSGTMKVGGMDKTFSGFQVLGYDNVQKQHQSLWCDNFGTGMFLFTGTADPAGKVVTYDAMMKDVATPNGRPYRMIVTIEGPDKHVIELWDSLADGKTLKKQGTVTATRKK